MELSIWFFIFSMIFINAFFVAAEFGGIGVRKGQILALVKKGNPMAMNFLEIHQNSKLFERYIAASQIGITISSLVLGAYGRAQLEIQLTLVFRKLGYLQEVAAVSVSIVIVLVGLTILQMVIGELVPKYITLQYTTQVVLITVIPMRFFMFLFSWFIDIANGGENFLLKIFKIPHCNHHNIHAPEEIELLISESEEIGVLNSHEQIRLQRALQMSKKTAKNIMVPRLRISAMEVNTSIKKALKKIAKDPYTRIPIYKNNIDNIIGTLSTKDLVLYCLNNKGEINIKDVMRLPLKVPSNTSIDNLLALLRENHRHQAVVIDEFGGVEGLVTTEDVMTEMMGHFQDEFKTTKLKHEILKDGLVRLPGLMKVQDTESILGVSWNSRTTTIGGHIIDVLGRLPVVNEIVIINDVKIKIEKIINNTVESIIVTPLNKLE